MGAGTVLFPRSVVPGTAAADQPILVGFGGGNTIGFAVTMPVSEERVADAPFQGGGSEQHEEEVKREAAVSFPGGGRVRREEIGRQAPPPWQGACRRAGQGQGQGPRRNNRCQAQKADLNGM